MSESNAVAVTPVPEKLKAQLARFRDSIAPLMRKGHDVERLLTLTLMSVANDEKLSQCSAMSIAKAASRIAGWGLEPGVTAHLVPFFNTKKEVMEVNAIADFKGLIQLMCECGARDVDPQVVREGDHFDYGYGLNPFLEHRPKVKRSGGTKITHAYCIVTLAHNVKKFEVMTIDEIDTLRKKYSKTQGKANESLDWYCRKTVVRRVAKYVPMHGEKGQRLALAVAQDSEVQDIADAEITPITGEITPIALELPRRAPTHAPLDVSAMEEEFSRPALKSATVTKPEPVNTVWADMPESEVFDPS
jgi:phage RecT family recombinase